MASFDHTSLSNMPAKADMETGVRGPTRAVKLLVWPCAEAGVSTNHLRGLRGGQLGSGLLALPRGG